jgi:hypothetical protein
MPDARELLIVGQAATRLPDITEAGLRCRIDRREIEVVRVAGRIFLTASALRAAFGDRYQPRPA